MRHRSDVRGAQGATGDLLPTAAVPERPAAPPALAPGSQCRRASRAPESAPASSRPGSGGGGPGLGDRNAPLVAHCHLGLGKLARCAGKREQARENLTTATTMYREMDMRFWLKQAEAEMAA